MTASRDDRIAEAASISDESVLFEIAKTDTSIFVRSTAFRKITDQRYLAQLAIIGQDGHHEGVERISDQVLLEEIYRTAKSRLSRQRAISKISNENLLLDIAKSNQEWAEAEEAVSALKNQQMLEDIACHAEFWSVRILAIKKILNMAVIEKISTNDPIDSVREAANDTLWGRRNELEEDKEYDILFLYQKKYVNVHGFGDGIASIEARISNSTPISIKAVVPPGIYFLSGGNHQNMVIRYRHVVTLKPKESEVFEFYASCMNAERPIPGGNDRFSGIGRAPDRLTRFLEAATRADELTVQAGVWVLTDNYSPSQIKRRLTIRGKDGIAHAAIEDKNIAEALQLLKGLGLLGAPEKSVVRDKPWWSFW